MSPKRVIDFPAEWATSPPIDSMALSFGDVHVAGLLLDDGGNLFAMIYPGGARFVRSAPQNEYGIEERYTGAPPSEEHAEVATREWRKLLSRMQDSHRKVDEWLRESGLPSARQACREDR